MDRICLQIIIQLRLVQTCPKSQFLAETDQNPPLRASYRDSLIILIKYFKLIGNSDLIVWLEIGMQLRIDYDTIFLQWHSVLSIGYSSNLKNCWCHWAACMEDWNVEEQLKSGQWTVHGLALAYCSIQPNAQGGELHRGSEIVPLFWLKNAIVWVLVFH